ncbi:putative hemoglobin and hemoglobin-haptoglobin-binding protein 3 precursor, partial [Haemophilus influenzae]
MRRIFSALFFLLLLSFIFKTFK